MKKKGDLQRVWPRLVNWLKPGLGIKRWLLLLILGVVIVGVGISSLLLALGQQAWLPESTVEQLTLARLPIGLRILAPLFIGGVLMIVAIVRLGTNLIAPFRRPGDEVAQSLYSHKQRKRGPQIVAIGGGTGLPSLLRGLRDHTDNITAVVTVADDGGSSGRLRRELGLLPPGDFRNNIAALARDEALMTQLLHYRFGGALEATGNGAASGELQGHAFGNLLLAALVGVTGSFDEALIAAERVLAIRGRVLPSTLANVTLVGQVAVGGADVLERIAGESAITKAGGRIDVVSLEPGEVAAYPPAVNAILQADLVVIGPGSLYTSILPNLLVPDIARALQHTRATRIYVCNVATQPGETDNYSVADHVAAIGRHVARQGLSTGDWVDVILANDNLSLPADAGGGKTVYVSLEQPPKTKVATADLVDEEQPWRHDSAKLAAAIMGLELT